MAYINYDTQGNTAGRWFLGLSTDTKPTLNAEDVDTRLMETDTGNEFKWTGTLWLPISRVSAITNALVTTGALETKIAEGGVFYAHHKQLVDEGDTLEIVIETPSDPYDVFMQGFSIKAGDGELDIAVYEDCTLLTPGTDIPIKNLNRDSSRTPEMVSFKHGTGQASTDGELIYENWIPPTGTKGNTAFGADKDFITKWILKNNINYYMIITNNSGDDIDIRAAWLWHEDIII
ncbi:MAG: hypothetical protein GY799_28775 [Desulfobulbaceae bacterium]|nr:hypothetical protein [Desulfobulbaceae bacterium]